MIEYKSQEDNLTIDDFYKTVGYACLYKGYGQYVDQIPIAELTVSIFRESYPRKLLLTLEQQGHKIEKIRKETTMCEALRELMKDEIEKDVNAEKEIAIKEGRAEGEANIIRIMNKNGLSSERIATSTGKSIEDVNLILEGRESWL